MKHFSGTLSLLSALFFCSFSLTAQFVDVSYPGMGKTVFVSYFDGNEMHKIIVPDLNEQPVVRVAADNATYDIDLGFLFDEGKPSAGKTRDDLPVVYEPGLPVEGDLPSDIEYSHDGSLIAVVYQNSDNVIFYDAVSYEMLASVQVGRQPLDIELGTDYAFICCHLGHCVDLISLSDYSFAESIPIDGTPCQLGLSPGEDTAYIACDSFLDGWMTAYDLKSDEVIYETHEPYFHHYGWTNAMGRVRYSITKFRLSPKGDRFICSYSIPVWPAIFDAGTGELIDTLRVGGFRGAAYSTTGDTIYIYTNSEDSVKMYLVNSTDNSLIDSVNYPAECYLGIVDYSDISANYDGTRFYVNDKYNDRSCLFDFNTHSCQIIPAALLYIDSPTFSSSDGRYAVSCNFTRTNLIDFESGQIYTTWQTGSRTCMPLCVSPTGSTFMVGNLPDYEFSNSDNENLYAFNFKNIDAMSVDTAIICGQAPEADVPSCVAVSNDGDKILSANALTHNVSVIDINSHNVDTIAFFSGITGVKVIPGSDEALVYGPKSPNTKLLSLVDFSVLAELNAAHAQDALISSDGKTGYCVEYMTGGQVSISKININGTASSVENKATIGGGYSIYFFISQEGVMYSSSALSPDNELLLIGYDDPVFGPVINIVDAQSLELLTSVPVPSYSIYGIAFTGDSKRVIIMGDTRQIPIIYLDGENSYTENYVTIDQNSLDGCFNPDNGMFYILEKSNYYDIVDPLTGDVTESVPFWQSYTWRIRMDKHGKPLILTPTSMIYDKEIYPMPGSSTVLTYNSERDLFLSPVPGPDMVCAFDPLQVGVQELPTGKNREFNMWPNPSNSVLYISSNSVIYKVEVFNLVGDIVSSRIFNDRHIEYRIEGLAPGIYPVIVHSVSATFSRKIVIIPK